MQNRSSRLMTVGAGNAIASDLESLIANQVSAVGSFAVPDHPESCSFNAAGLIYSCTKSGDGKSVVKSYQFLDTSGSPMDKFVKGTTEAIHYPLSGVFVRVVDYTVVSTGKQLETTTVHKHAVVTFNGTADVPISLGDYSCVLHLDTHPLSGQMHARMLFKPAPNLVPRRPAGDTRSSRSAAMSRIVLVPPPGSALLAALCLISGLGAPCRLHAQASGSIVGRVTAETGLALAGASVSVEGTQLRAITDERGEFRLIGVPAGAASIQARRLGFRPVSALIRVTPSSDAEVNFRLQIVAENLEPVMVKGEKMTYSGRLAGYYERLERRNGGVFITREEIERDNPRSLTHILQRVAGVTIARLRGGATGVRLRDRTCAPLVWLDGNALQGGEIDLDTFEPRSLQGVEIYLGSTTAPSRYVWNRDSSNCGTILLWSRSGETERPTEVPSSAAQLEDMVAAKSVFTPDQVDEAAHLESNAPLEITYPPELFAEHLEGVVVAEFVVDVDGKVESETFGVVSSDHPLFTEAVRRALGRAMFAPAMRAGKRVRQLVHQPFEFARAKK